MTLFPEMIEHAFQFGVVGQAMKAGLFQLETLSPRTFTSNVHQTIDDRPFGGGDGMVMMAEPATLALNELNKNPSLRRKVIHLSPRGVPFTDALARELACYEELVLISSRYGGIDERFLNRHEIEEISIGDYVLSGGEIPALVLIDGIARHLPGVLGNEASAQDESFAQKRLESPQFTRPREWAGQKVPAVLLSGDHRKVARWKKALALFVTLERRPDLLRHSPDEIGEFERRDAAEIGALMTDAELRVCGIRNVAGLREVLALWARVAKEKTKRKR